MRIDELIQSIEGQY